MTSSRFAVAVHILALLEASGGEPVTSEFIAKSVNTNPAVVRRIVSMLAKHGITTSQLGAGGGALLARPAADVSLLEVLHAVEDCEFFAMHHSEPNPQCPVGRNIQGVLETATCAAQEALEAELKDRSIADVFKQVKTQDEAA